MMPRLLCYSLIALVMVGCTVGPDYRSPDTQLPAHWSAEHDRQTLDSHAVRKWWREFDDPALTALIERAADDNLQLQAALARIEQSRALRDFAAGRRLGQVDAVGAYTRTRPGTLGRGGADSQSLSVYSAGFDAVWEPDFFGRIRRSIEAAQATLERSVQDYHYIRISLLAEVARNYFELRIAQGRIAYAHSNIEIQRANLQLTRNLFEAEIAPALDVSQARLILANTEAEIPSLRIAESAAMNRLAVLLGTTSGELTELLKPADLPVFEVEPAAGVPAELLRRRPDIRAAERALAAQTAQVGVAEAQRYPSFSLAGTLGFEATHFSDLGNWSNRTYGFGPATRWTLFDGNRLRSLVEVEEALLRQAAAAYEQTVLTAVEEVENALVGLAQQQQRTVALARSVSAAKETLDNAQTLYRSGLRSFQNVLDAQRSLTQQQDLLVLSQGQVLQQAVALYRALGGGWQYEDIQQNDYDN